MTEDDNSKDSDNRRHRRFGLYRNVRLEIDGETIIGETRDVSACGAAIETPVDIPNDVFVDLHVENLGDLSGHVVRKFDGGFAVEFDPVAAEKERLEKKLRDMFATDDDDFDPEKERQDMEDKFRSMFEGDDGGKE